MKCKVKKDCFAFQGNNCYCLNKLFCSSAECNFYKPSEICKIEKSIEKYKERKK